MSNERREEQRWKEGQRTEEREREWQRMGKGDGVITLSFFDDSPPSSLFSFQFELVFTLVLCVFVYVYVWPLSDPGTTVARSSQRNPREK